VKPVGIGGKRGEGKEGGNLQEKGSPCRLPLRSDAVGEARLREKGRKKEKETYTN